MVKTSFVGVISLLPSWVSSYALPELCTGVCVNTHDPSIIRRADGTYFRFSTGGKIAIHTAPSITGPWTYKGAALPGGSSINIPGNQDLWAPAISGSSANNYYHLFYSVSTFGSQTSAIGLATSPTLDSGSNTWTDHGSINLTSSPSTPYNAIDPSLIVDPGTQASHLVFGSFWRGIFILPLTTLPNSNPPRFTVQQSPSQAIQLAFDPSDPAIEGPNIYFRDGFFYLFFSKGSCCGYDKSMPAKGKEYRIMVCRSAGVAGPYLDKQGKDCRSGGGTILLESHGWVYGPGGQGVYEDQGGVGGAVLHYHYVDTRVGYQDGQKRFGWNKLGWGDGGWPFV
ncbi:glycosyl hydrolase [Cladorrhinum samala]|uniref:Arabinan endo-1,5-alpha-L-arabinosidase n=1 Tax=Cladorrhinum samala TaxID=585594 RepID=A0AAV9I419_9PEZI|nr:glycosyl hydrolase [Cladorrhinum samala]